jgi:hypothetical protein
LYFYEEKFIFFYILYILLLKYFEKVKNEEKIIKALYLIEDRKEEGVLNIYCSKETSIYVTAKDKRPD